MDFTFPVFSPIYSSWLTLKTKKDKGKDEKKEGSYNEEITEQINSEENRKRSIDKVIKERNLIELLPHGCKPPRTSQVAVNIHDH